MARIKMKMNTSETTLNKAFKEFMPFRQGGQNNAGNTEKQVQ